MKRYLSKQLIDHIIKRSEDPIWKTLGFSFMFTSNWYDIIKVSTGGLIFFEGNSDTGFQHILERHSSNDKNYFNVEKDPSKFNRSVVPIKDFIMIADDIYHAHNKDVRDHKDSALFDKFTGESSVAGNTKGKFHLVLY